MALWSCLEAAGEGAQVVLVVGLDGGGPVFEAVAMQTGEDLGAPGGVAGKGRLGAGSIPSPGPEL